MRYRLNDADRERLGCPEWLEFDVHHYPVELAEAIEAAGGQWTQYQAGTTTGLRLRVWVGLRNAGIDVDLKTLTFDLAGFQIEEVDPGKASAPDDGITNSDSSSTSD